MKTDRPIRVGVYRDEATAHRVVEEARRNGFRRVTVVSEDPAVRERFRLVCSVSGVKDGHCESLVHTPPGEMSVAAALAGAGVGLVAGFVAVAVLGSTYGVLGAILNTAIPLAAAVWGAFIGAMISRAWQGEPENFYDQEVGEGEILVAIEEHDSGRLQAAEAILRGTGVQPIPLTQG